MSKIAKFQKGTRGLGKENNPLTAKEAAAIVKGKTLTDIAQKRNRWTNKLGPSINIAARLAEAKKELDQINKMDQAKSNKTKVIQKHIEDEMALAA
jgi:hypothetical protein